MTVVLIARITKNWELVPVFHLCRDCSDYREIDFPVRWRGEDERRLCLTCQDRIAKGQCRPFLGPEM